MELKINCESAREALETVVRITGADHANVEVRKKDIFISAAGSSKSVRVLVKGEIISCGKREEGFGFNTFTLSSIFKGRTEVIFNAGDKDVTFKSTSKGSKFEGTFHPLPFENISLSEDEHTQDVTIKGNVMNALLEAVRRVSISSLFTTEPMTLFVRLDKTGLYTTVYDGYHLAFLHNAAVPSEEAVEFSLTLPLFDMISSVAKGQDYTLSVGPVYVSAKGLGFELSLPTLQTAEGQSFETAMEFANGISQKGACKLEISVADLAQTLDNLAAVSDGSSGVVVEADKGHVKFSLKSNFGNASERRKIEVDGRWDGKKFTLNPALFRDTIGVVAGDNLRLMFATDNVSFVEEAGSIKAVYSCLLM